MPVNDYLAPLSRVGLPEETAPTMLCGVRDATCASGNGFPANGGMLSGIVFGG